MRGMDERIDRGNWYDALLRQAARWGAAASKRATARLETRRATYALLPGNRVLLAGSCLCARSSANRNRYAVLIRYLPDQDEYSAAIIPQSEEEPIRTVYVCARGFEVVGKCNLAPRFEAFLEREAAFWNRARHDS